MKSLESCNLPLVSHNLKDLLTLCIFQGNDAAYTLHAMIGIAFSSLVKNYNHQSRLETLTKDAEERANQEAEEWEQAVEERGDGGLAVHLNPQEPVRAIPAKSKKVLALEKASRLKKRAEEGAKSRMVVSNGNNEKVGNWASWADINNSNGKGQVDKWGSREDGKKEGDASSQNVQTIIPEDANGGQRNEDASNKNANIVIPESRNEVHQNKATSVNQITAAAMGDTIVEPPEKVKPRTTEKLPSHFTERMAFLDMDDDEGGVTIVYK